MNNKEDNFKEKFKQALISTAKVISDDYKFDLNNKNKNLSSKNIDFFELDNLKNRQDFVRLRAKADSKALKKKFSNKKIYQNNLPNNTSCRTLYDISEKIRYELLGTKILKGISKNLSENYNQKLNLKRKDQLKTREDVNVAEAFELYMLKNFFSIKLNPLSDKILSFWEKEFDSSLGNHINFLTKNLENQKKYNSKFSEILQKMDIFNSDNEKSDDQENKNEQDANPNNNDQNQTQEEQEKNRQDENQNGIDADYDFDEHKMDEQLVDTDSEKQSSENVIQKINTSINDKEYKIFTNQFDEIAKAETLESIDEINKLRKNSCDIYQANLTDPNEINSLIDKVKQDTKKLNVLINNASSFYPTPIQEASEEQWKNLLDTNATTPLFLIQGFQKGLQESRGSVINISDSLASKGIKNYSLYSSAKGALETLTKSLAKELAPEIRINAVAPGAILWPEDEEINEETKNSILEKVNLRRIGDPKDIASAVYFLTQASYITGQVLKVDGGRSVI